VLDLSGMDEKKKPEKGEGDYEATRRYDRAVTEYLETEDAEESARKALEEVERDEPRYRKAEEDGKRRSAGEDPELYRKGEKKDRID
jgi:hypothetical protein